MMVSKRIAVLMTCYNRRQKTIDCLAALFGNELQPAVQLDVYLVDDGSTDGTAAAVTEAFPQVNILQGNGNLFWTGGMELAFTEALKQDYDHHLWLNDDTILYPTALHTLLTTAQTLLEQKHISAIVVGSTCDPTTGNLTYGGIGKGSWLHPCRFKWLDPTHEPQPCDTMNGNCVLIPREVVQKVGTLDLTFRHYAADFDYGLRAKQQGCHVWIAPNYVATCPPNPAHARVKTNQAEWQNLTQPKGVATKDVTLHPFWEWQKFTQRHAGLFWVIYWLLPYRRMFSILRSGKLQEAKPDAT